MCDRSVGGKIDVRCRDDKGEPIKSRNNSILSGDKSYKFNCTASSGAMCQPMIVNRTCPDFAIQVLCTCLPKPSGKNAYYTVCIYACIVNKWILLTKIWSCFFPTIK